ncbi:hypothetical protein [Pseudactinotalea sp. Z1732]|uniref:hypothetical protein n=1 Tax=Pseudactinotalea sp. Z1732 TaxID=3413026 RepID=UPI003C7BA724
MLRDIPGPVWGALATILAGTLTFLGVWLSTKQTDRATRVERRAKAAENEVDRDRLRLHQYEGLVDRMEKRLEAVESRVTHLEAELAKERRERRQEREAFEVRHRSTVRYLRDVLAWAGRHLPGVPPPTPPTDVAADLT